MRLNVYLLGTRLIGALCIIGMLMGCGEAWKASARTSVTPQHLQTIRGNQAAALHVAVLPFSFDPDPVAATQITEVFTAELLSIPYYTIVERQRISDVLQEHKLAMTGILDQQQAVNIGQMVGAQAVVLGKITDYRQEPGWTGLEYFGLSVRMVDTASGVVLWSGTHNLDSGPLSVPDSLEGLVLFTIRELIGDLRSQLMTSPANRVPAAPVAAPVTAPKPPAPTPTPTVAPAPQRQPISLKEIQTGLTRLGYHPGRADGLYGSRTRDAIMAFQKAQGMTADGAISAELLQAIRHQLAP